LIQILIKHFGFLIFFSLIVLTFLVSNTTETLFFGILNAVFHGLWTNYALGVQIYSFLFYFMPCYYFEIRIKILSNNISRNSKLSVVKLTARIIREHNNICNNIFEYNKFWKSFYFTLMYTIIPMNLMHLQQLLLDDIVLTTILIYSMVAIIYLFSHIILNLISVSVNTNASKSY
jgi:hypothetical protein